MNSTSAINAYTKVGTESAINGADPHELISMLFKGALFAISDAKAEMARNETVAKGKSISKAIAIIGEGLNASLDQRVGGELSKELSSLYGFMVNRLVTANLHNDVAILDEVTRLLAELSGAWDSIRPQVLQNVSQTNSSVNAKRSYATA